MGFGVLGILSIGLPFLVLGLALLVLTPSRNAPERFWPPLVGIAAFFLGFLLVAPLGCTTSAVARATGGLAPAPQAHTVCTNAIGLHYAEGAGYNPSLVPALVAGLLFAVAGWSVSRLLIVRLGGRTPAAASGSGKDPWRWLGVGAALAAALLAWFLAIPALLLLVVLVVVLALRRAEGWPLVLTGFGLVTAPFTLRAWLAPQCQNEFIDLPHHVYRCLQREPSEMWPALVSLGLIAIGLLLFWRQRKRAASASPVG